MTQAVTIKFKRLVAHAQDEKDLVPATKLAAGVDLVAVDHCYDEDNKYHEYGVGIAVEIPPGYELQIRPRSSIRKKSLVLVNSPGTIDADYRGELIVTFKEIDDRGEIYAVGERIAQAVLVPIPQVRYEEVDELTDTERGDGGFGSTGS
jgi:dUTP pyrophosphatase